MKPCAATGSKTFGSSGIKATTWHTVPSSIYNHSTKRVQRQLACNCRQQLRLRKRHLANATKNIHCLRFWPICSIRWKNDVIHKTRNAQRRTSYCRKTRTEQRPQVTCTENLVKFGHKVFEISNWVDTQTNKQTYRHADRSTSSTYRCEVTTKRRHLHAILVPFCKHLYLFTYSLHGTLTFKNWWTVHRRNGHYFNVGKSSIPRTNGVRQSLTCQVLQCVPTRSWTSIRTGAAGCRRRGLSVDTRTRSVLQEQEECPVYSINNILLILLIHLK